MNRSFDAEARDIIKNLKLESSYSENDLGMFLYNTILRLAPERIVEFGTLYGYSAVCMGLALRTLGKGSLNCFDLWEEYPFKNSKLDEVQDVINSFGLEKFVTLKKGNIFEEDWSSLDFDFCHIDISNDGDKMKRIHEIFSKKISVGVPIIFEGGTEERDNYPWMIKYGRRPIRSIKSETGFVVVNEKFPGISVFGESIANKIFGKRERTS